MNENFWDRLCATLEVDSTTVSIQEIVEAVEALRAETAIQTENLRVMGEEAAAMQDTVQKAEAWYRALLELNWYKPGEAGAWSPYRSDRWPFEVDLVAAVEKYLSTTKRSSAS